VVQTVVIRADQNQVFQFCGPAILPMLQVMCVQAAGGPAPGHHTAAMVAVLEGAA
jgi:hypothetical protein